MNIQHVNDAIAVMRRVKYEGRPLQMEAWQTVKSGNWIGTTEEELHACGTAACFAGWLAVSPEFKRAGGGVGASGTPRLGVSSSAGAVALYLGIPYDEASGLCAMQSRCYRMYGTDRAESLTVDDVLTALYRLRDTGSCWPAGGAI